MFLKTKAWFRQYHFFHVRDEPAHTYKWYLKTNQQRGSKTSIPLPSHTGPSSSCPCQTQLLDIVSHLTEHCNMLLLHHLHERKNLPHHLCDPTQVGWSRRWQGSHSLTSHGPESGAWGGRGTVLMRAPQWWLSYARDHSGFLWSLLDLSHFQSCLFHHPIPTSK